VEAEENSKLNFDFANIFMHVHAIATELNNLASLKKVIICSRF